MLQVDNVRWSTGSLEDSIAIVTDIGDLDSLRGHMLRFQPLPGLLYSASGLQLDEASLRLAAKAITDIINSRAVASADAACRVTVPDDVMAHLTHEGVVEWHTASTGARGWRMTAQGMQRLLFGRRLDPNPTNVFDVRWDIPLADRTEFELLETLKAAGWTWRKWRALSQRGRSAAIPDGFKPGDAKVFFTPGHTVARPYIIALLKAEDIRHYSYYLLRLLISYYSYYSYHPSPLTTTTVVVSGKW